jgi:peptide/nickel transport system permease protein
MILKDNYFINVIGKRKDIRAGTGIIVFFIIVAIIGVIHPPYNPVASVGPNYLPPSLQFLFGTTSVGQDVFSQWMFGASSSLLVGFLAAIMTMSIGVLVGIISGFVRYMDEPLMRLTDVILTLPALPLLIVLAAFVQPSLFTVAALIALLAWAGTARVIRSGTLALREMPYVELALISGVPKIRIMFVDLLKHLLPLILAYSLFAIVGAILTEASLDFIGVGPISDYSWGAIIAIANQNNAIFNGAWWWLIPPGLSIAMLSTGFALAAYGLEHSFKTA